MDKGAIATGLVVGLLLAFATWVFTRDDIATQAEQLEIIEKAIELALEKERERGNLEQQNIITRLDSQEAAREQFRVEVRGAIVSLQTSQHQMLQALVTLAGGQ